MDREQEWVGASTKDKFELELVLWLAIHSPQSTPDQKRVGKRDGKITRTAMKIMRLVEYKVCNSEFMR